MRRGSIFAATFVRGEDNYGGDDWVYCAPYTLERIMDLARERSLVCQAIEWPHPTAQQWILLRTQES